LLDPICRVFVETNRRTAWILGRTISLALEGKREVAAFDLKSPKFSTPDQYTQNDMMKCVADKESKPYWAVECDPHDLKTLAYYQTYRAQCQGERALTKLHELEPGKHLQDGMAPYASRHAYHSFSSGLAVGMMASVIQELTKPEDTTCDALSKKWAQKDLAFDKLVGKPFICDGETGIILENRLATDAGLLEKQGLTDYSLFLKVYEHNDDAWEFQGDFPFTARVTLDLKTYIIAIGIIDYGEKYTWMSETLKFGTTTMLAPDRYKKYFTGIVAKTGYITYEDQPDSIPDNSSFW